MKRAAIEKAKARIEDARIALEAVKASEDFADFRYAWKDFLAALKGVHSIFEASATAKKDPKAYGWYARKIGERRRDPLLRYVHAARNAEEYGVEPIAEHVPALMTIGGPGETIHVRTLIFGEDGKIAHYDVTTPDGKLLLPKITPAHVKLITVHDERFGDSFDPPKEHLGKSVRIGSPLEVAELALSYHERLVDEAERYVT